MQMSSVQQVDDSVINSQMWKQDLMNSAFKLRLLTASDRKIQLSAHGTLLGYGKNYMFLFLTKTSATTTQRRCLFLRNELFSVSFPHDKYQSQQNSNPLPSFRGCLPAKSLNAPITTGRE